MVEVNRFMEHIYQRCKGVPVMMGVVLAPALGDRLSVALIAARPEEAGAAPAGPQEAEAPRRALLAPRQSPSDLETQFLSANRSPRPQSRFVPPAPAATPERVQQLQKGSAAGGARSRKAAAKLRQTQLALDIIAKGRFDKSEPTIYKGEDLDVPTYIRRGVPLN
jgi:cell division protein FtsZ